MNIFYYRVHDESYPRNARIRAYLGRDHHIYAYQWSDRNSRLARAVVDLRALIKGSRDADIIVLSEFGLSHTPFVWLASRIRSSMLVVDGFVRIYETLGEDYLQTTRWTPRGMYYRLIDRISLELSDVYLTDTLVRADELTSARWTTPNILALPMGAPAWAKYSSKIPSEPRRFLYYGNYLPLHGVEDMIRAFAQLPSNRATLTMLGDGALRPVAQQLVDKLNLETQVTFMDPMPAEDLAVQIAEHDVVLGIFGGSHKARTVIANKVWQGLYAGRVVVTQGSAALDEIRGASATALVESIPGNMESLVSALEVAISRSSRPLPDVSSDLDEIVECRFASLSELITKRAIETGDVH